MAIAVGTILKAVLFIGLLLLCIGIYYYKFDPRKEGFQSTPWDSTKCDVSGTNEYCNSECGTDRVTPPENLDEQLAYDIYEVKNLDSPPLTEPLPKVPTTNTIFNAASALAPFDYNPKNPTPIPWDYDNAMLNPAYSLWGVIPPQVSQLIYTKAEAQYACSDIKNIYVNPNNSRVQYESQYFNEIIYDPVQIVLLTFADNFIDFFAEELFETVLGKVLFDPIKKSRYMYLIKRAAKAEELTKAIANIKTEKGLSKDAVLSAIDVQRAKQNAKNAVAIRDAGGEFKSAWKAYSAVEKWEAAANASYINIYKLASGEGKNKIEGVKAVFKNFISFGAVKGVKAGAQDIKDIKAGLEAGAELGEGTSLAKRGLASKSEVIGSAKVYNYLKKPIGLGKSILGAVRPGKLINAYQGAKDQLKAAGKQLKKLAAASLRKLGDKIRNRVIADIAIRAAKNISKALNKMMNITGVLFPIWPVGTAIAVFLNVLILCCITVIPALFNSFINVDTAQCPFGSDGIQMSNLYDSINYSSAAGPIGWNLLTGIPGFGDILYAFAPYLCFAVTDAQRSGGAIQLKRNLITPPYYDDPTLSLYSVQSKPEFLSGSGVDDPRLNDPAAYHDCPAPQTLQDPPVSANAYVDTVTCGYKERINSRVWVDYSNEYMLNKMAQFYFDSSRKFMETTQDGMVQFEYISKFYGLISTTELTCDVQCEITVVKLNITTGIKICESILPIPAGSATKYHDRRFYFFKDLSKGMKASERVASDPAGRMADNYLKFIVTACTHVDGTAPDAIAYSAENSQVTNPVISLGDPGVEFTTPALLTNTEQEIKVDLNANCSVIRRKHIVSGSRQPTTDKNPTESTSISTSSLAINTGDSKAKTKWISEYLGTNNLKKQNVVRINGQEFRSTKFLAMVLYGCPPSSNTCNINQGDGIIATQMVSGYLPFRWGFKGMIGATVLDITETNSLIQCTLSLASLNQGASVLNGLNVISSVASTSFTSGFVSVMGPTIDYSPGYTPKINWCKKQGLELYDCVNRHTVRSFVLQYNKQYPDRQLKKILNISPRPVTSGDISFSDENQLFKTRDSNLVYQPNTIPMCVFEVEYAQFDSISFSERPLDPTGEYPTETIAMALKQDTDFKTCTFKQDTSRTLITMLTPIKIAPFDPFTKDMEEPDIPVSGGFCSNKPIIDNIIDQFNKAPENIHNLRVSYIDQSTAMTVSNGNKPLYQCIYDMQIQNYDAYASPHNYDAGTNTVNDSTAVWRTTMPISKVTVTLEGPPDGNSVKVQYFPYTNGTDTRIVKNTFVPTGCGNSNFDCSDPMLQRNLMLNFNQAHINIPEILKINSSYTISSKTQSLYKCIFNADFKNVYDIRTDVSANYVVKRNVSMNLKPAFLSGYSYPYLRFEITAVRTAGTTPSITGFQLYNNLAYPYFVDQADANFLTNNAAGDVTISTTNSTNALNIKSRAPFPSGSTPASVVNLWTPYTKKVGTASINVLGGIQINNTVNIQSTKKPIPIVFTSYAFGMSASPTGAGDPTSWMLSGSLDGTTWYPIDNCCIKGLETTSTLTTISAYTHKDNTFTNMIYPSIPKCMYDLDFDDFPQYMKYVDVPKTGQWLDIPPRAQTVNTSFLRPTCTKDVNPNYSSYSDCSNAVVIDHLVTQFNIQNPNTKILEVNRSYTPAPRSSDITAICDYSVQMLRTLPNSNTKIASKETVRLNLRPSETDPCLYNLRSYTLSRVNSGYSLNQSEYLGMLDKPYVWGTSLTKYITNKSNTFIQYFLGMDVINVINSIASTGLKNITELRNQVYTTQRLLQCNKDDNTKCAQLSCRDQSVYEAMINRYNFDNYPTYDLVNNPQNNTVIKRSVVLINRAGTAMSTRCQFELREKVEIFDDFLYKSSNINQSFFLKKYRMDILRCNDTTRVLPNGNTVNQPNPNEPCTYKMVPFTLDDIKYATMDISGDTFAIDDDSTLIKPTGRDLNGRLYGYDSDGNIITLPQLFIPPNDPAVLNAVKNAYESNVIFTKPDNITGVLTQFKHKIYSDTTNSFIKWFNAKPNICEYKVQVTHVNYDKDYSIVYYTGKPNEGSNQGYGPDVTYLVAVWDELAGNYEVESGFYCKDANGNFCSSTTTGAIVCTPTITEIYFPDLTFNIEGTVTKEDENGNTVQVILPYIANDGVTPGMDPKNKLYGCNPASCIDSNGKRI